MKQNTHISIINIKVLDEVHERNIDSDFVLLSLKYLLSKSKIKIIIMSASLNAEKFSDYFSE